MPIYKAPVQDTLFVLQDVLRTQDYGNLPGFGEATPDLIKAILTEGAKFAEEVLQPLNLSGDNRGCKRDPNGRVTTPEGFQQAYEQFVAAGWGSLSVEPVFGGQGLPHFLSNALQEYLISANMAFMMYPGLTLGAIAAICAVGAEEQKARYVPKMAAGVWTGTMNLTEPHCGTDLGLIKTRAAVQADGTYRLTGTKIFISAGEHDLSKNIIHLVLAKMTDSPDNIKGISLFIVPKFLVTPDGALGERNLVSCGSIEEKMGIHGNATCVMNYDGATGYLLGEKDKGLRAMFVMMNAARLGVALQGLSQSEVAYQNAATYARERRQGRALRGPQCPQDSADPILVHPDVRRMLMTARAFNEGARGLALWGALQVDLANVASTPAARQDAEDLIGLLTPVFKAYFTDQGFANAVNAQQCLGGHGYIREWGMEQFVRDARIAMIYEGTNGIQALDLVGRKLAANGGRALRLFTGQVSTLVQHTLTEPSVAEFAAAVEHGLGDLQAATQWLIRNALMKPENAGAASTPYLYLLALVSMGYMWLQMARAAAVGLTEHPDEHAFYAAKLDTARYFFCHLMPETSLHKIRVEVGAEPLMALPAEAF